MLVQVTAYGSRTDLLQLQSLVLTPRKETPHRAFIGYPGVRIAEFPVEKLLVGKVGGFVLYANSKANATQDCETVVSCTNLGKKTVELSCRFFHGFFPIRLGGPGEALCSADTPKVAPGDTNECATDTTADPKFQSGGIFLAEDGDCPPFEGKGLVCAKGGDASQVFCMAHLSCGNGTVLERITVIRRKGSKKDKKPKGD